MESRQMHQKTNATIAKHRRRSWKISIVNSVIQMDATMQHTTAQLRYSVWFQ